MMRPMRRVLLASLLLWACDSKRGDESNAKAEPPAPALPTPEDVCAACKTVSLPDNVFVLSATTTTGSIKFNFDQTAALAENTELRAESEPPDGERQMYKGFVHARRLPLTDEGWLGVVLGCVD
jgi:hypothetical protein